MFLLFVPLVWAASFEPPKCPIPKYQDIPQVNSWLHLFNFFLSPDNLAMNRRNYFKGKNAMPHLRTTFMSNPVVGITDIESAKLVLDNPNDFASMPGSSPTVSRLLNELTSTMLLGMNAPEVHKYRSILRHSFTGVGSRQTFESVTTQLCGKVLDPLVGTHVDVFDVFQRTAMDAMGKSLLGFELNTLGKESTMLDDYRAFSPKISIRAHYYSESTILEVIGLINKFKNHLRRAYAEYKIEDHEGDHYLLTELKERVAKQEINEKEAIDLMTFMFVAGQETTAATLAALAYNLAKYPSIQDRLRKEIIAEKDTGLLTNCIKETLRLYSPTLLLQSRRAVNERFLPLNQRVWILLHGIHRSERYWPEPDRFNPDRFNEKQNAWIPFGHGTRTCPGQNFAMKEIEAVMRVILGRYSIHLPANSPHQDYLHCHVANLLTPKDLKLVFNRLGDDRLVVSNPIVPLLPYRFSVSNYPVMVKMTLILALFLIMRFAFFG